MSKAFNTQFPNSERFSAEVGSNSSKALAKNIPVDMDNIVVSKQVEA